MSNLIIDVTELDFEFEVIKFSFNTPVVVDFWAPWCKPCKTLSPQLEKITLESGGNFRLARVNVDQNPTLTMQFNVNTIPTVKIFSQGQIISEFVNLLPENRIREILGKIVPPSPLRLAYEKATSMLNAQDWEQAEEIFSEILEKNPTHPPSLLGLAKTRLGLGKPYEAKTILDQFPDSKEFTKAETLSPLCEMMIARIEDTLPDDHDLDAVFSNSIRLAERGNLQAALDGLLDILRQDKNFKNHSVHKTILGILELLDPDEPETRQYRTELASILF